LETTAVFEDSIDLTRLTAPGLVLDVAGGGEGIVGKVLGRRVVSIDLSLAELQEASNDALKMVGDAAALPFLDGSFDEATCFFGLMYMPVDSLPSVFAEAYRVLRPGGRLRVWDVNMRERSFIIGLKVHTSKATLSTGYGVYSPDRRQTIMQIEDLAAGAGFVTLGRAGTAHTFHLSLLKPYAVDASMPQLAAIVPTAAGDMQIVRASAADVDGAFDVLSDSCRRVVEFGRPMPPWLFTEEGRMHVADKVRDCDYFIGRAEGRPAAAAWLKWADPAAWGDCAHAESAGYLHGLGVKREWAGFGLGVAMLDWCTQYVAGRGLELLRLECDAPNPRIRSYYESLGFTGRGIIPGPTPLQRYEIRC